MTTVNATQPVRNITVSASAGSGKTWQLITRILQLLIAGAEPGEILALTFTRKAAGEMQSRIKQRLFELAMLDKTSLIDELKKSDCATDSESLHRAQSLYENVLNAVFPLRVQTFHSFCQDLLYSFPLEANVAPGFNLLENTSLLEQQSWENLFSEATKNQSTALTSHLDTLMDAFNSADNTRKALHDFLEHRSDWWAYTENKNNPVEFATNNLSNSLKLDENYNATDFFTKERFVTLQEFSELLKLNPTDTNIKHAVLIEQSTTLANSDQALDTLIPAFIKADNTPRNRKKTKAQLKKMGDEKENKFLTLHEQISSKLLTIIDIRKRLTTFSINTAIYHAGNTYINTFQKLKKELRLLDFQDLEWSCYQLLNTSDNAEWIQYKIDQRIDHILIDEFQDTNSTQWHLLFPLLKEMAANPEERWRSVFLVGDTKQSIYSFRRAKPELQQMATTWLQKNLASETRSLEKSWRSSPAIIDLVNNIFTQKDIAIHMRDFIKHETHLDGMSGYVAVLPLCKDKEEKTENHNTDFKLRNPLLEPRPECVSLSRQQEANNITQHIQKSLEQKLTVSDKDSTRLLEYGDIKILFRHKKHMHIYETALRKNGIPYIGSNRDLLDNLEIKDIEKLLHYLITPYNNLALAQVLKSPIFSVTDEDLILLSGIKNETHWFNRLSILADSLTADSALVRAHVLLNKWKKIADKIPVHDFLDHIYSEGNLLERYKAATSIEQRPGVYSNLQALLQLSLDVNSGRYPGLSHFLHYLESQRSSSNSSLTELSNDDTGSSVQIMTIHAAKGLEAPMVILADAAYTATDKTAYSMMIDWPSSALQPKLIQLITNKESTDNITSRKLEELSVTNVREEINLLYVALTRAKQYLVVSGTETKKSSISGWYSTVKTAMESLDCKNIEDTVLYNFKPTPGTNITKKKKPQITHDEESIDRNLIQQLGKPLPLAKSDKSFTAPSQVTDKPHDLYSDENNTGFERGLAIHRALDLLTRKDPWAIADVKQQLRELTKIDIKNKQLDEWINEANSTIQHKQFAEIFTADNEVKFYNEVPLLYRLNDEKVYGIIDRLIVKNQHVLIIDYKTHSNANEQNVAKISEGYRKQLEMYEHGIKQIWPNHTIQSALLFTACAQLVSLTNT